MKYITYTATALIILAAGYFAYQQYKPKVASFDECAAAGYPVQETSPQRCSVPGKDTFVNLAPGQEITLKGELSCLPHKDQSGAQTLECAYGLRTTDGLYYALNDPNMRYLMTISMGKQIEITGTADKSSDRTNDVYDTVGTVTITGVRE